MNTLIAQLEHDQYDEKQGDSYERAWRIGHNTTVHLGIAILKLGSDDLLEHLLVFVTEHHGDEIKQAFCRGANAGRRHIRHVIETEERRRCAAADEAFARVDVGLQELVESTGGDQ